MTRQWSNDGPVNGPQYYLIKRAIDINVMRRSYALEFLNFDINTVGKQAFLQYSVKKAATVALYLQTTTITFTL